MKENIIELKKGIKLHTIDTNMFKTDLSVLFITIPLQRDTITKDVIIPEILKSGSQNLRKQIDIYRKLDNLYGASLETGTDKTGKNIVIKIYIESVSDKFIPNKEESNLKNCMNLLFDIAFNPLIEKEAFKQEYVEIEKERRRIIIETESDDKDAYSYNRAINIMYQNCGFGINKNGYIEDLDDIDSKNLYERYKEIINQGKIDIFIAGNLEKSGIEKYIKENQIINNLPERDEDKYYIDITKETKQKNKENVSVERMDVSQGKLVIGLDIIGEMSSDDRFLALLYNTILGDGANSKLFRIVREQESLAYTCKSNYIVQKSNIFIRAGIDTENYDKTVELIKKLIEDMKKGDFSEEDIENAKNFIYSGIDAIKEEKDTAIIFYYGEELSLNKITIEEYYEKIKNVKKEDIVKIANKIEYNTIYFLKN